jgi:hypothetical protein
MHEKPIALVRFSMNLYFCHTPLAIWNMLSLLRFCLSRTSTMRLYNQAITIPVYQRLGWQTHETTAVLGADNMHYITYMHTPHVNEEGKVHYTKVYNTINIWELYPQYKISPYNETNRQMLPNITDYNVDYMAHQIVFRKEHYDMWLNSSWRHVTTIKEQNLPLSAYPHTNEHVEPPHIEIHKPLHRVSTASYAHVEKLLEYIYNKKIKEQQYKLVILFCDEQLFARVWELLAKMGNIWGDILPFPGDLHFKMHVCLGIMRIGQEYLLPLANHFGYKYIKVDFALKAWHQHDDFLLMVADGAVEWLQRLLPEKRKDGSFSDIIASVSHNEHISLPYNYNI